MAASPFLASTATSPTSYPVSRTLCDNGIPIANARRIMTGPVCMYRGSSIMGPERQDSSISTLHHVLLPLSLLSIPSIPHLVLSYLWRAPLFQFSLLYSFYLASQADHVDRASYYLPHASTVSIHSFLPSVPFVRRFAFLPPTSSTIYSYPRCTSQDLRAWQRSLPLFVLLPHLLQRMAMPLPVVELEQLCWRMRFKAGPSTTEAMRLGLLK